MSAISPHSVSRHKRRLSRRLTWRQRASPPAPPHRPSSAMRRCARPARAAGRRRRRPDRSGARPRSLKKRTASGIVIVPGRVVGLCGHQLSRQQEFERIDAIFAADVPPAAGDLLGQDRALHDQHADRIGRRRRGDRFGQRGQMIGELGGEQGAGHRRAHHPAHDAGHADHRPESGVAGKELADQEAGAAAEDQQRREDPARSAGAERDQPYDAP